MNFSDLRARFENPKAALVISTQEEGVFENNPSPSTANYRCDLDTPSAEQSCTFENSPEPSPAFTSYARTVNSADGPHASVFESDPVLSGADFHP